MEKDIDVIIAVDPSEAEKLIGLIELLIHEWYVLRHERQQRLEEIVAIGKAKSETDGMPPDVLKGGKDE